MMIFPFIVLNAIVQNAAILDLSSVFRRTRIKVFMELNKHNYFFSFLFKNYSAQAVSECDLFIRDTVFSCVYVYARKYVRVVSDVYVVRVFFTYI
mgnify:CR=1 FL=1